MGFEVAGESYARFMGVYAEPLAARFAEFADIRAGREVLDVGCGPGALTAELVRRCGAQAVRAIDPSAPFAEANRSRHPDVEVTLGAAEGLPYADDSFDAAMAQLVVPFMADPDAGLREMTRVTRPGGVVAVCAWNHVDNVGPLSPFWSAVRAADPGHGPGESPVVADRERHLSDYVTNAGLQDIVRAELTVEVTFPSVDAWWEPLTLGVGPAGDFVAGLSEERREQIRATAAGRFAHEPFTITARANAVRGRVPGR